MSPFRRAAALAAVVVTVAGVSPAVLAADAAAGRQKAGMCRTCHGLDGVARIPDAPHLAGESPVYLERQLQAFRSGERKHEQMSIIAQSLSDQDIADLAAWYSSIEFTAKVPTP